MTNENTQEGPSEVDDSGSSHCSPPLLIPELNTSFLFWTCPVCEGEEVKWRGSKAWCTMCGRSTDDSVCQCGEPSYRNKLGAFVGCCEACLPF